MCSFRRYGEQKWILRSCRRTTGKHPTPRSRSVCRNSLITNSSISMDGMHEPQRLSIVVHRVACASMCPWCGRPFVPSEMISFVAVSNVQPKKWIRTEEKARTISAFSICWFAYLFSVYRMLIVAILGGSRVLPLYCRSFVDIERNKLDFRCRSPQDNDTSQWRAICRYFDFSCLCDFLLLFSHLATVPALSLITDRTFNHYIHPSR